MTCTFCDYFEATLQIMMMMESMPTEICEVCEASMTTPHYIVAEADTQLVQGSPCTPTYRGQCIQTPPYIGAAPPVDNPVYKSLPIVNLNTG